VENITRWGVWVHVSGSEFFLDHERFPWFRDATVGEIQNVRLIRKSYLRWPDLDVDLDLNCLADPERYPLVYR
jgi:hypothetical protein